jgi:hypothetical protein
MTITSFMVFGIAIVVIAKEMLNAQVVVVLQVSAEKREVYIDLILTIFVIKLHQARNN